MKRVLVLGAGLVARPMVRYLLDRSNLHVTVADRTVPHAEALIGEHPRGSVCGFTVDDTPLLIRLIDDHDIVVSLLPAHLHDAVAIRCVERRTDLITASYVTSQMQALDAPAREAGVLLLNEMGMDPGIDHMSAMKLIDDVGRRGGEVVSFRSYCGGLPAPDANDNPFGYKFSWSPRGVLMAAKSDARWREDGREIRVAGARLCDEPRRLSLPGAGTFEVIPNRDALDYVDRYGVPRIETMFRATMRYPGWCETIRALSVLGMLDERPTRLAAGTTLADFTASFLGGTGVSHLRQRVARRLALAEPSPVLDRLEWLGIFGDDVIIGTETEIAAIDVLAKRMQDKMSYAPGERDMVLLRHEFVARFGGGAEERITSTLLAFGEPEGDSAMARTVGLPVAIAVTLVLEDRIRATGVCIPVTSEIYEPVLETLATLGLECVEKVECAAADEGS